MLLSGFLKSLSSLFSDQRASGTSLRRTHGRFRRESAKCLHKPAIEALENRILLSSVTVDGTALGDEISVSDASATEIAVTVNGTTTNYAKPTGGSDLTFFLNGKAGNDTITIAGDVNLPGVEFILQAEEIVVAPNVSVTAGDITFAARGSDAGLSIADSLPIGASVGDRSIEVRPGATLSADNIDLQAQRVNSLLHGARPFGGSDNSADIIVTGANISAVDNVSITTTAADENINDGVPTVVTNASDNDRTDGLPGGTGGGLIGFASGFLFDGLMPSIPLALMIRRSETSITIDGNTVIDAGGDIEIASSSVTDATTSSVTGNYGNKTNSGLVKFLDTLSVGYSQASAGADVSITDTTSITAGGDVDIKSKAKSVAAVTATTKRNTEAADLSSNNAAERSPSDTSALGASFAMSNTRTTATASIAEGVTIVADGNVNVKAEGDVTNKAKAGLKIYVDGKGGLAVAIGLDETNVLANVNGTITSAAGTNTTVVLPLTSINDATDIINIPNHGLTDGEVITYRAIDPDDAEDANGNEKVVDAVGGLADGLEYIVIVIDDDNFQLTQASAIELDARAIPGTDQHTFSLSEVVEFDPQNGSVNTSTDAIGLQTDQIAGGTLVTYQMADSDPDANGDPEPIEGLIDGETYVAINVQQVGTQAVFQLADLQDPTTPLDLTGTGAGDAHFFGFHRSGSQAISLSPNSAVDHEENTISILNHGLQTGDVLSYETDRDAAPNRRTVPRYTMLLPPEVVTFVETTVDIDTDTVTVFDAVDFATGHRIKYFAGNSPIGGLTDGDFYYAIRLADDNIAANGFQVAATLADALAGNAIDLTSTGAGEHAFEVDPLHASEIAIRSHGFETGQEVTYRADGSPSAGLVDGDTYFVIRADANRFALADTRALALAGSARVLTDTYETSELQRFETDVVVDLFDATRDAATIDAFNDTINIPNHQLIDGATVVYRASGPTPGDVEADATYRVQVVDGDNIRLLDEATLQAIELDLPGDLGNGFHSLDVLYADIDTTTDTFFLSDHGLQPDDIVEYSANSDTPIGGLTDGERYAVDRINGDELRLKELDVDGIPTDTIVDISAGAANDVLHSIVPADDDDAEPLEFTPAVLSPPSGVTQLRFDASAVPGVTPIGNIIRLTHHGMATGDTVRYVADLAGGTTVGGLTNGTEYTVDVLDTHRFVLRNASGDVIDLTDAATGDGRHGFERLNTITVFQSPIRGLEDRAFYFVSVIDGDTIQLAETAGDAFAIRAIDLDSSAAAGAAHQLLTGSSSGIGIKSSLTAKNEAEAGSGLGGAPKFTDLLFSGDTQSPFSFTDPSSFKNPRDSSALQRGILNNKSKDTLRGAGGESNDTFSVAAGIAVSHVKHDVRTVIGPNAVLTSQIDVDIASSITQKLKVKGEGSVSSDDKQADSTDQSLNSSFRTNKPKKRDKDKKFAFGAGIAVGIYDNVAVTDIQSGATIDAGDDVDIDAVVVYPLKANPISLLPFGGYYEPGADPAEVDFISELKSLIGGNLGLSDIVNVWANSKAGGSGTKDGGAAKVALSGSIAVTDYENIAKVHVGSGVNINQNELLRNVNQSVSVNAGVKMELVSMVGQVSIGLNKEGIQNAHKKRIAGEKWASKLFSFYGNNASEVGIGGSALAQTINNFVDARIAAGARIYTGTAGTLAVDAIEDIFTFEFVQSGGKSGKVGISGTVSVIQQDSHTVAHLENGATINGGDVRVDADNKTRHIALLGAIQTGKSLGVGVTAGLQFIERNTLAIVGNELVNVAASAVDDDRDRIRIPAHGFFGGEEVRYSAEGGAPIAGLTDGATYFVVKDNERHIQLAATQASATADDPVTISLDASNAGDDHQFEVVRDEQIADFTSSDVTPTVSAIDIAEHGWQTGDAVLYTHGAAGAVGGIGPAPGVLYVIRDTDDRLKLAATLEDARNSIAIPLTTVGTTGTQRLERVLMFDVTDVAVTADNDGYIVGLGIAGASVSNTKSDDKAEEEQGPQSEGASGVFDAARDVGLASSSPSGGIAGGLGGIGNDTADNSSPRKSGVAIAGDASWNQLEGRALAILNDNGWIRATDVDVAAAETTDVYAISGAVAIANAENTAVALAGSFQRNKIDMTTEAIVAGPNIELSGDLSADSSRTGDLIGISVGVAGSKVSNNAKAGEKNKGFALGGSVAVNTIDNVTRATIDEVSGTVDGAVSATTDNDSVIFAIGGGAGIAINGQVGFGAGVGVNTVRTTTESLVANVDLGLNNTVNVSAMNDILLESLGVSAGVGQFGIAGTFAVNEIDPVTSAMISDSNLQLNDDNVKLTALDKSRIRADAGGVAIGIKNAKAGGDEETAAAGAFGVAVSLNQIGTRDGSGTIAAIENSTLDNPGDVTVDAESQAQITGLTLAGSVALAKQSGSQKGSLALAGAGAGSRNVLTTDIIASISDSMVTFPNDVSVTATDHARIHADSGGFAISGSLNSGSGSSTAVGIGIGVAVNDLFGSTQAEIIDSDVGSLFGAASSIEVKAMAEDPDDNRAIEALAMGGSLAVGIGTGSGQSGAFAGAGAITRNRIFRNVIADVIDSTAVAAGDIDVLAVDKSTINGDAGGVSIAVGASTSSGGGTSGSGSVGVSVAINEIGSRDDDLGVVAARVVDSTVVGFDVTVDSRSIATIDAVSIAGSVSVSASAGANSFSGSAAVSFTDNVIEKSIISAVIGTQISSFGDVIVASGDDSFIRSVVVGAAISVSASASGTSGTLTIGASVAENTINNSTRALVEGSTINATGGDVTVQSTADAMALGQLPTDIPAELIAAASPVGAILNNTLLDQVFPEIFTTAALLDELATTEKDNKDTEENERQLDEFIVDPLFEVVLQTIWNDPTYLGGDLSDSFKVTFMSSDEVDEALQAGVGNRATGNGWLIADRRNFRTYQVLELADGTLQVRAVNIQAISAAASVSVSAGTNSIGIAGAGASTRNVVLSTNEAVVSGSTLTATGSAAGRDGDINVEARKVHGIVSTVVAAAVGVGVSSGGSGGAGAIGASLARNFIGYEADGTRSPATARAILDDSQVTAEGALSVDALTAQKITTVVIAASVGVSASPGGGVSAGLSGAGASAINRIAADAEAEIRSIDATDLNTDTINVTAVDQSIIRATAGAVAVSVAFAPDISVAVALGVGLARNTITSEATATVVDSTITTPGADLNVIASSTSIIEAVAFAASVSVGVSGAGLGFALSGAGAEATNIIQTHTDAAISNSDIRGLDNVAVDADSLAEIEATVVSIAVGVGFGSAVGAGAAIGASLARNFVGYQPDTDFTPTLTTGNTDARRVNFGETVRIEAGVRAGDVYRYIGRDENGAAVPFEAPDDFDDNFPEDIDVSWLATIDYGKSDRWELVNLDRADSSVKAQVQNSTLELNEDLKVLATGEQTINAIVVAGSGAVGVGGFAGGAASGSGVAATNRIATTIVADIVGAGVATSGFVNTARNVEVRALDRSTIDVFAGAVALSVAFGPVFSTSIALGVSVARNDIANDVTAAIRDIRFSANEAIIVNGRGLSTIEATSFATSFSVALAGLTAGLAFSGAGADAINSINSQTFAFVHDASLVTQNGNISVHAGNSASIDAEVVAVSAAVSAGAAAAAGSIGAALTRNEIGGGGSDQHETRAWIEDSVINSGGQVFVTSGSSETIRSVGAAGAVAIAIGLGGFGGAGTGTDVVSRIDGTTEARASESLIVASGPITISAADNSRIVDVEAAGAAVAGGLVSGAIGVTLVENTITNEVTTVVDNGTILWPRGAGTNVAASSINTIGTADSPIVAATAAVSAGVSGFSGAGVDVDNTISNDVSANFIDGATILDGGDVTITAREVSDIYADAAAAAASFSIGVAGGVALMDATVNSDVSTDVSDATITAANVSVIADTKAHIPRNFTVGVAGSLGVGVTQNRSTTTVAPLTTTDLVGTAITADAIEINATGNHLGHSEADGGAFGGVADTGMVARTNFGRGTGIDEVRATVGNGSELNATDVIIRATAVDDITARTTAASVGVIAVEASKSEVESHLQPNAGVDGATINANNVTIVSQHDQLIDATADSFSLGVGSGSGAGLEVVATGGAIVDVSNSASITAEAINVEAINNAQRKRNANLNTRDLYVAPYALLSVTEVTATTALGLPALGGMPAQPMQAEINLSDGVALQTIERADGRPSELNVTALNNINARQILEVEGSSTIAVTTGINNLISNNEAVINTSADLTNRHGDVLLNTSTDATLTADGELLVFSLGGGGGVDARSLLTTDNIVNITGGEILAEEVKVWAGRRFNEIGGIRTGDLKSQTNTGVTTVSLVNIDDTIPTTNVNWENQINVTNDASVLALRDVNLIAERYLQNTPEAKAEGAVLNLSLAGIGEGLELDDSNTAVVGASSVQVGSGANVRGGLESESVAIIRPVSFNGVPQRGGDRIGEALTAADKAHFGLQPEVDFYFAPLADGLPVTVTDDTVVRVAASHTAGGTANQRYRFRLTEPELIVLEDEDYANSVRWQPVTEAEADGLATYGSDLAAAVAADLQGRFFAIQNVDQPQLQLSVTSLGAQLTAQLRQIDEWIASHAGDTEAILRYRAQQEALRNTIESLGLFTERVLDSGTVERILNPDFDAVFVSVPDLEATPGSVFIEATASNAVAAINAGALRASGNAHIEIRNNAPFNLVTGAAEINDNKRVTYVNGELVTLEAGRVYENFVPVDPPSASIDSEIEIRQNPANLPPIDLNGREVPDVPLDLYINDDVVNEDGRLVVQNLSGSVNVNGTLRANPVNIESARDFNLNTAGWYHAGGDPRQLLNWDSRRNTALTNGSYVENSANSDLQAAIENDSSVISNGNINITARYLNVNGLIQSGVTEIELTLFPAYQPADGDTLLQPNGDPFPGVFFGPDTPTTAIRGTFEEDRTDRGAIVIAPLAPAGGSIFIAGQIFSTGNGRLVAASGEADISINNRTFHDLVIEGIDNTADRTGRITIVDTVNQNRTVYTNTETGTTEEFFTGQINSNTLDVTYTSQGTRDYATGASLQYFPNSDNQLVDTPAAERLSYTWVDGQDFSTETTFTYIARGFNLFGTENSISAQLVADEFEVGVDGPFTLDNQPLLISETLESGLTGPIPALQIGYEQIEVDSVQTLSEPIITGGKWLRPFSVEISLKQSEVNKQVFTSTLRADYPIDIGFAETGNRPRIDLRSERDLILAGDVNASENGIVDLKTTFGIPIASQNFATIYGAELFVDAGNNTELFVQGGMEITADVTGAGIYPGNLTISSVSEDNQSSTIDVKRIDAFGDVLLDGPDGIRTTASALSDGTHISGHNIELNASTGSIGPIRIDTADDGGFAAEADGFLVVTEVTGDLTLMDPATRPGEASVVVPDGPAILHADGAIVDGITEEPGYLSEEAAQQLADRLRLTGALAEDAAREQIDAEQRQETALYHDYWRIVRQATYTTTERTVPVTGFLSDGNFIDLAFEADFGQGSPIFYEVGFDLTTTDFASETWLWSAITALDAGDTIAYDVNTLTAGSLTVMNPGEIVSDAGGNLYEYIGDAAPVTDLRTDVPYFVASGNERIALAGDRYPAAVFSPDRVLIDHGYVSGGFDQIRFAVRNIEAIDWAEVDLNDLSPQDRRRFEDFHNSLSPTEEYDSNFVRRLSAAEQFDRIEARTISEDQIRFALSGAMTAELLPTAPRSTIFGSRFNTERNNIEADYIELNADAIGSLRASTTIDYSNGFSALPDAQKALLASSSPNDIVGSFYTSWQYVGESLGNTDLSTIDFNSSDWLELVPDFVTSVDSSPSQVLPFDLVLNDRPDNYGLFRYIGQTPINNPSGQRVLGQANFSDTNRWERLSPTHNLDDGTVELLQNHVVQDRTQLQSVTLQPLDDVNVESNSLNTNAANDIAIESFADIIIGRITGDDIQIQTSGDITNESTSFAVLATGDVVLRAASVGGRDVNATNNDRYLSVAIGAQGSLGGSVSGDFFVRQLGTDFGGVSVGTLKVSRIDANGDVEIVVDEGSLNLGYITSDGTASLEALFGIYNTEFRVDGDLEWNVLADKIILNAGDQIGDLGSADVGVQAATELIATTPGRIFMNSPADLPIGTVSGSNINIVVGGDVTLDDGSSITGSQVRLLVHDDITAATGSTITATGNVNLFADTIDDDPEGAAVTLAGTITAATTVVGTGNDNDLIDATLLATRVVINTSGGDDRIVGGLAGDRINAGPGNDHVAAGPGPDTILGGPGDDELFGGPGDDRYIFEDTGIDNEEDLISELPGEGTSDTVDFTQTAASKTSVGGNELVRTGVRVVRLPDASQREEIEYGLNIDPLVLPVQAPSLMFTGVPDDFEATWYDVGTRTEHTSEVIWGDGSAEPGTLVDNGNTGTISGQHAYASTGTFVPEFVVTDGRGSSSSNIAFVDVIDPEPTADAGGPYVIDEGSSLTLDGSGSGDETGSGLTYRWDVDGDGDFDENITGATPTLTWQQLVDLGITDGPYAGTIGLSVANDFDADAAATTLSVNNIAPQVDSVQLTPEIDEGGQATLLITFSDPGTADTHTVDVNWGDGSGIQTIAVPAGDRTLELTHTYANNLPGNASYTVGTTVTDDDGASGSASGTVVVKNVAPTIDGIRVDTEIDENGTATLEVDFSDVGVEDTHTVEINWGDGSNVEVISIPAGEYSLTRSHQYLDDESGAADDLFPITVRVIDNDGDDVSSTGNLLVNNVAPTLTNIVSSTNSIDCISHDGTVTVSGEFSDIGSLDTHTLTIDWGDGSAPTILTPADDAFSETHVYSGGGTFAVTITVEDDDGGAASQTVNALLTGTQLSNGTLRIYGTDRRDIVKVWHSHGHVYVKTKLGTNGWTWESFPAADVDHFQVVTCDGNDYVWLKPASHVTTFVQTGNGRDRIYTGNGIDQVDSGADSDLIYSNGGNDVINAGSGNDYIFSGTGDDEVDAGDGHDRVYSWTGDDIIFAGAGNDFVDTGHGDDRIEGGDGNDYLKGQTGDDVILGGAGHDRIYAGYGDNLVLGGSGNDVIYGGYGNDVLVGGDGHDCIHGYGGNDIIIGGLGSDWIDGSHGRDLLIAGATDYDENEAALDALYTEWNSSDSWSDKISNLRTGNGTRLNGVRLEAGTSVHDDTAVDHIRGGRDTDWFFASPTDRLRDRRWWEIWSRPN